MSRGAGERGVMAGETGSWDKAGKNPLPRAITSLGARPNEERTTRSGDGVVALALVGGDDRGDVGGSRRIGNNKGKNRVPIVALLQVASVAAGVQFGLGIAVVAIDAVCTRIGHPACICKSDMVVWTHLRDDRATVSGSLQRCVQE